MAGRYTTRLLDEEILVGTRNFSTIPLGRMGREPDSALEPVEDDADTRPVAEDACCFFLGAISLEIWSRDKGPRKKDMAHRD